MSNSTAQAGQYIEINGHWIGQGDLQGTAITHTREGYLMTVRGVPKELRKKGPGDWLPKGSKLAKKSDFHVVWVKGTPCKTRSGKSAIRVVYWSNRAEPSTLDSGALTEWLAVYRPPTTPSKPVEVGQVLRVIREGVVQAIRDRPSIATGATKGAPALWYCTCAPYTLVRQTVGSNACALCKAPLQRVEQVRVLVPKHWCGKGTKTREWRKNLGATLSKGAAALVTNTAKLARALGNLARLDETELQNLCERYPCALARALLKQDCYKVDALYDTDMIGELIAEHTVLKDQLP